jgi:predicted nucleic acid-binding protein
LSWLSDPLARGPVVLDASVIINLLGCGEMRAVLLALGVPALVEERTLQEVRRHPLPGQDHRAELDGLVAQGLLYVERMTDAEYEIFLGLVAGARAGRLAVGESAAIALACRGHTVVLDENKARTIVARDFRHLALGSTLQTLLTAGCRGGWSVERVQGLVLAARRHARMGVPKDEVQDLLRFMDGVQGWSGR